MRIRTTTRVHLAGLAVMALTVAIARAGDGPTSVSLLEPRKPLLGWTFGLGQEFKGAKGGADKVDVGGRPALHLRGDFTEGGKYVHATRNAPRGIDPDRISMSVRSPGAERVTLRVIDQSGQCHQFRIRLTPSERPQTVDFPLRAFMLDKTNADAARMLAGRYEYWGGKKDGQWHGPAKSVSVVLSPTRPDEKVVELWVDRFELIPRPETVTEMRAMNLLGVIADETEWALSLAEKARGTLTVVPDAGPDGQAALRLAGDFTEGGATAAMVLNLDRLDIENLTLRVKPEGGLERYTFRLVDDSGQVHQRARMAFPAADADGWHTLDCNPAKIAGGEHWGGRKDGRWNGPAKQLYLGIGPWGGNTPALLVGAADARVSVESEVRPAAYEAGFEGDASKTKPEGWTVAGDVQVVDGGAFQGKRSLAFARSEKNPEIDTFATGPTFPARAGSWRCSVALTSDLYSPDASFRGDVRVQALDGGGKVLANLELALTTTPEPWKETVKTLIFPAGTAGARFRIAMDKTWGTFRVDALSAAFLAPASATEGSVAAIKFASDALGNLFLPDQPVAFDVIVEARKPLPETARTARVVVRDYWGAEMAPPFPVTLAADGRTKDGRRVYKGRADLSAAPWAVGRYYELHGELDDPDLDRPFRDASSFAVLPPSPNKAYRPHEIPFTARGWDNRSADYIRLSDRLGIRWAGIRSGWDYNDPQKVHATIIELARDLDMGAVLRTVVPELEHRRGDWKKINPKMVREGMESLVRRYKDELPLMISTGNEPPHGDEERIKQNIEAYRAVYEGAKAADPNVIVIGTAVGTVESFFRLGFAPYQDVFDFHLYEDPESIRKTFARYDEWFKKYDIEPKPIWSTEIGLNCQGMARLAVASDMMKKYATFFACGGGSMSWFGVVYPDPTGKNAGSTGDSFNIFNSKYNLWSPRLDAVANYHLVNGVSIKQFVEEKRYDNGVRAVLMRDAEGRALVFLWMEKGRADVHFPMNDVGAVTTTRIDGSQGRLDAAPAAGLTLSVAEEPMLLTFASATFRLPEALDGARVRVPVSGEWAWKPAVKGADVEILFNGLTRERVNGTLTAPFGWTVDEAAVKIDGAADDLERIVHPHLFRLTAPERTDAREARLVFTLADQSGELFVPLPVADEIVPTLTPLPYNAQGHAGFGWRIENNSPAPRTLAWRVAVPEDIEPNDKGQYQLGNRRPFEPRFTGNADGTITVQPGAAATGEVRADNLDPIHIHRAELFVKGDGTPDAGLTDTRYFGGFAAAPRATRKPALDGTLSGPDWAKAPVVKLDQAKQFAPLRDNPVWEGPEALSAKARFLWDDECLYLGVEVTDRVFVHGQADNQLWNQDGLQLLIDPARANAEKAGKFDYAIGLGKNGFAAYRHYSADPALAVGLVAAIRGTVRETGKQGDVVYEIAIPWKDLSPFKPGVGANLGLCLAVNNDNGQGRNAFIAWFGDAHWKQIDAVGDLVLTR